MKTEADYRKFHYDGSSTWTKALLTLGVTQWKFIEDSDGKIVDKRTRVLNPYNPLSYIAVPLFLIVSLIVRVIEGIPDLVQEIKESFQYN